MARRIREHDWDATPLGPIACWPQSLKTIVDLMLASPGMMSLVWGAEAIHIYNDAFAQLPREHQSMSLGGSALKTFAPSRDVFEADLAAGMAGRSARLLAQPYAVLRSGRLEDAWLDTDYAPVRNEEGGVGGVLWTLKEVTAQVLTERALREREERLRGMLDAMFWRDVSDRKQAEAALKGSEEKYRALFESMDEAYAVVEVLKDSAGNWFDFRFLDANPAFMIHTNMPYPVGRTATELLGTPNPRWTELYGEALDTGRPLRVEESEATLGIIFDLNIFALDRERNRVAVLFTNITERKRAQAALRDSEERQRTLIEGVPQLVWRSGHEGHWTWTSPQWTAFTGQTSEESRGRGWLDPVHPDDRAAAIAGWIVAGEQGAFEADYRLFSVSEGQYRWFHARASPVRGAGGEIVEWLGTSTDIDELRNLQQRQQLLLAELQHRVRNTLSVIKTVARRTAERSGSVDEMAAHLDGRIEAFARVQAVVTRAPGAGVGLRDLVEGELLAHAIREGERLRIDGPALTLNPRAAETISLAVHELATNAVKHGSLAGRQGGVDVRWRLDGDVLHFSWKEWGLDHDLAPPSREGFGMELLVESLPYELDAETQISFEPGGLRFTLQAANKTVLVQQVAPS